MHASIDSHDAISFPPASSVEASSTIPYCRARHTYDKHLALLHGYLNTRNKMYPRTSEPRKRLKISSATHESRRSKHQPIYDTITADSCVSGLEIVDKTASPHGQFGTISGRGRGLVAFFGRPLFLPPPDNWDWTMGTNRSCRCCTWELRADQFRGGPSPGLKGCGLVSPP